MAGGKRDADAAGLENHDPPDTAALSDVAVVFPVATFVICLVTPAGLLRLIQTPSINLTGTVFLNGSVTLRFIYAVILNGADLYPD
jgi:hypothetical protein